MNFVVTETTYCSVKQVILFSYATSITWDTEIKQWVIVIWQCYWHLMDLTMPVCPCSMITFYKSSCICRNTRYANIHLMILITRWVKKLHTRVRNWYSPTLKKVKRDTTCLYHPLCFYRSNTDGLILLDFTFAANNTVNRQLKM